jgi:branched-chain amino acid transport system ATP-binding protein
MTTAPLLAIHGARKAFGGLVAVRDVSLSVEAGEVVGLIGPNGSGKTTLINLISGLLPPDAGAITLAGEEMAGRPAHRLARAGIARTFQLVRVIPEMTALENVLAGMVCRAGIGWGQAAEREAAALLARVGLSGREDTLAADMPYGDQKRVELARALALRPKLLLLDEWLAGLSPAELTGGIALVASLGGGDTAIIMVEHVMPAIHSLCPRCVVMNNGALIADGPTPEVMADRGVIAAYLGEDDA